VALSGQAPRSVRRDFPLAGLATVRTGGPAELFARAGGEAELVELLGWAAHAGVEVNVVGSGSNLLVADEGVRGLVLKLDRGLAAIELDAPRARACRGSSSASTSPGRSAGLCA
jgi:UDP-N-acetylmuramate dehydrogenase